MLTDSQAWEYETLRPPRGPTKKATRRRAFVALALVAILSVGGCLTLSPTVTADLGGSSVFEGVSTDDSWASGDVQTSVSLTPNATTSGGIGQLNVIGSGGTTFSTTSLDAGETNATVLLPANANATIVALNPINGTTIENHTVRTDGNKVF